MMEREAEATTPHHATTPPLVDDLETVVAIAGAYLWLQDNDTGSDGDPKDKAALERVEAWVKALRSVGPTPGVEPKSCKACEGEARVQAEVFREVWAKKVSVPAKQFEAWLRERRFAPGCVGRAALSEDGQPPNESNYPVFEEGFNAGWNTAKSGTKRSQIDAARSAHWLMSDAHAALRSVGPTPAVERRTEPSEQVESVARALYDLHPSPSGNPPAWADLTDVARSWYRKKAEIALRAGAPTEEPNATLLLRAAEAAREGAPDAAELQQQFRERLGAPQSKGTV